VKELLIDTYVTTYLQTWWYIVCTLCCYWLIFAFEYRLNGGIGSLWRGLWEELKWFTPGGYERRLEYLKHDVFPDWQSPSRPQCNDSYTFAAALRNNDTGKYVNLFD
jgi:hypothetical protein